MNTQAADGSLAKFSMSSTPAEPLCIPPTDGLNRLTVVMATFHSGHCAPELGRSLASFPHVIVVDNASSDDTVTRIKASIPQAQVLINARNLGFGAANNRAVCLATTEFVLLLNPDCVMSQEAALALMHTLDLYAGASACGPQLLGRHGQEDLSYCMRVNGWPMSGPSAQGHTCVGFLSGACMLIRRQAMAQIKGFDEDFFLYQEDADLCLRLAANCGPLIVSPDARVTHYSRGSSGGRGRLKAEYIRGYHHIQSKFIFNAKHEFPKIPTWQRHRYALTAALELLLRVVILDITRAARVLGRMVGAWRYNADLSLKNSSS